MVHTAYNSSVCVLLGITHKHVNAKVVTTHIQFYAMLHYIMCHPAIKICVTISGLQQGALIHLTLFWGFFFLANDKY